MNPDKNVRMILIELLLEILLIVLIIKELLKVDMKMFTNQDINQDINVRIDVLLLEKLLNPDMDMKKIVRIVQIRPELIKIKDSLTDIVP